MALRQTYLERARAKLAHTRVDTRSYERNELYEIRSAGRAAEDAVTEVDYRLDPRPDIAADHPLWVRLLAHAYGRDCHRPDGVYGALHGLRCLGARLAADGDRLRYRAPAGVLTVQDRAALRERKPDLLALLTRERPGLCGRCGGAVTASPDPEWPGEWGYTCAACRHTGWLSRADAPPPAPPVAPDVAAFVARLPILRRAHERYRHGGREQEWHHVTARCWRCSACWPQQGGAS